MFSAGRGCEEGSGLKEPEEVGRRVIMLKLLGHAKIFDLYQRAIDS